MKFTDNTTGELNLIVDPEKDPIWIGSINCPPEYVRMLPNGLRAYADFLEEKMKESRFEFDPPTHIKKDE